MKLLQSEKVVGLFFFSSIQLKTNYSLNAKAAIVGCFQTTFVFPNNFCINKSFSHHVLIHSYRIMSEDYSVVEESQK